MKLIRLAIAVALPMLVLVASCAKDSSSNFGSGPTATKTATPSIAASVAPAAVQYNHGRTAVNFDPCIGVGDSAISEIGFDPATRERKDQIDDRYSFIGCMFDQKGSVDGSVMDVRELRIWSTNVTMDEFRQRYAGKFTDAKVNGRDALIHPDGAGTCFLETAGPDGTLDFQLGILDPNSTEQACEKIIDIASVIQSVVPR
ncbi:DUF3558 domain-containing protein [Nocardia sp. CA2R105]|uniref:DUF3558 domain-containing protein n=1 Tax=Nocardia coffeae TaxID=2873381 RepID=UPI001CA6D25D|nr:DUF3558 domain-containing protein [Nocardia coffeae]MBY8858556.1 DUF3558 domain-containing protein [Nocardia coffeae]